MGLRHEGGAFDMRWGYSGCDSVCMGCGLLVLCGWD